MSVAVCRSLPSEVNTRGGKVARDRKGEAAWDKDGVRLDPWLRGGPGHMILWIVVSESSMWGRALPVRMDNHRA